MTGGGHRPAAPRQSQVRGHGCRVDAVGCRGHLDWVYRTRPSLRLMVVLVAAALHVPSLNGGLLSLPWRRSEPSVGNRQPGHGTIPIRVIRDLPYAPDGATNDRLRLDVHAPPDAQDCPVLILVHGGAWRTGDKTSQSLVAHQVPFFVGQGFVVVAVNYRLSPAVRHPVHVQDVAHAIAWVHDHIGNHGGTADRLFVMGHSAGGHLALLAGCDGRWLQAHGKSPAVLSGIVSLDAAAYDLPLQMDDLRAPPAVARMVANAFGTDRQVWRDASPRLQIGAARDTPPVLLLQTGRKAWETVPAREMLETLRAAGIPASLIPVQDRDHTSLNRRIGTGNDPYTDAILRFLRDPCRLPGQ